MIKAVIFDIDNTLMDFMRMKRASVDAAVDAMLDAGLPMKKEKMYESIFETYWKEVRGSKPVETFGHEEYVEPEPVTVNVEVMIENFRTGFQQFSSLWKEIFCKDCFD